MSKRLNINSVPALVGIVGPIVVIVGDLAASLSTPGYSLVRKSVSSLALEPIGWLQSICFLAMGLLLEIFVAGLFFNIRRARGFYAGIVLLALCGFVLMLIAAFHMDAPEAQRTTAGIIHTIASYGLGLLFPVAILSLAPSLKSTPNWKNVFVYTLVAGVLALGLILGAILGKQAGWFGLYERIIILNALVWVEVVAVHFLRLLLKREPKPQSWQSGVNGGKS
jgi:MFS family permease